MFGKKKRENELAQQKREQVKRYGHVVESAVKIYAENIAEAQGTKSRRFHQDRLDAFLIEVKRSPEYKENSKMFDKLIAKATNILESKPAASSASGKQSKTTAKKSGTKNGGKKRK